MTETKDEIAGQRDDALAQRDEALAEVARLRTQLASNGLGKVYQPAATFQLSEGDRQELTIYGIANIGGRLRTIDEVRDLLGADSKVPLPDPPEETDRRGELAAGAPLERTTGIRGFDYVYPSVAPGVIDPAVAGTPGISGPPAAEK